VPAWQASCSDRSAISSECCHASCRFGELNIGRMAAHVITFCEVSKPKRAIALASVAIGARVPNSAELARRITSPAMAGSMLAASSTSATQARSSRIRLSVRRAACGKTGARQDST
jgi:hypothetical protein